ncbi:MAG TPA: ABC transporter ATP-binding protein [Candidatus Saccharibacteria bacterium]|nr:ABC transporter ATP-binding protein [Candidatus Saccharibacteria bacterium]HRQ98204.1 ABC transporter ATP-binding protein [Candidatus Saccharibacteria bacterium]
MAKNKKRKLTTREYIFAIFGVARITYKSAPFAVFIQFIGSLITAILPIITTFFAALTTTELAEAYAGNTNAGEQAIIYVIITAALGVFMTVWRSIENYITELTRYRIESAVSDRMYEHFLQLDFWRYDDKKTADLYDRSMRFANFFPYIFTRLADMLTQFVTMIAGIAALVIVSWWLGLIVIVAVIPGIVIQFKLTRASTKHWSENIETRRAKSMIEWDLMTPSNIAELRLYGIIRRLLDLRLTLRDKDEKQRIEFERKYIAKRLMADVLEAGAEVTALLWVVIQIIGRSQPIGQFIYVQQIVSRALGGANGFVSSISSLDEDIANLFDYQEFMALPVHKGGEHQLTGAPDVIDISHVSFHYPQTNKNVLHDIALTIKKGQRVAIVGENGAGKSTLIKIITGLYSPTKGDVLLDGKSIKDYRVESWHKHLGVLQQNYLAYGFATARDNIFYGDVSAPFDQKRFDAAIDLAEAREFLNKLPKKMDSFVNVWMEDDQGNSGIQLSGGQWQRLALARNFYRDSPIVILDEPTSAIDALAESRIFKHLFESKNKTIITVSHRLTTVKRADVIYMLKDGKLVEQGTHAELVDKKGEYFTMFESQL